MGRISSAPTARRVDGDRADRPAVARTSSQATGHGRGDGRARRAGWASTCATRARAGGRAARSRRSSRRGSPPAASRTSPRRFDGGGVTWSDSAASARPSPRTRTSRPTIRCFPRSISRASAPFPCRARPSPSRPTRAGRPPLPRRSASTRRRSWPTCSGSPRPRSARSSMTASSPPRPAGLAAERLRHGFVATLAGMADVPVMFRSWASRRPSWMPSIPGAAGAAGQVAIRRTAMTVCTPRRSDDGWDMRRGAAAVPHRGRDRPQPQHHRPQQLARHSVRPVDQPLSRLRAWLRLLLSRGRPRPARAFAGARLRDAAASPSRAPPSCWPRRLRKPGYQVRRSPSAPTPIPTSRSRRRTASCARCSRCCGSIATR